MAEFHCSKLEKITEAKFWINQDWTIDFWGLPIQESNLKMQSNQIDWIYSDIFHINIYSIYFKMYILMNRVVFKPVFLDCCYTLLVMSLVMFDGMPIIP